MICQLPYLVNKAPTAPGMPFSGRGPWQNYVHNCAVEPVSAIAIYLITLLSWLDLLQLVQTAEVFGFYTSVIQLYFN